jgi:hypothetical protein
MSNYDFLKVLHVLTGAAIVGTIMLTPKWLCLAHHDIGRSALHNLHQLTSISSWLALVSGGIMLILRHDGMLFYLWMQISIAIFLVIRIFDHFWAYRREEELTHNSNTSTTYLKTWLLIKLALYFLITMLMLLKL